MLVGCHRQLTHVDGLSPTDILCVPVHSGCEITDEEAEKIFTCQDAVELLKTKLDVH